MKQKQKTPIAFKCYICFPGTEKAYRKKKEVNFHRDFTINF